MKYKNENDNRYWVRFMPSTEELMKQLSVSGFIAYLEANAELEDEDHEWLDGRVVAAKYYLLPETDNLRKEFIVAEDGRVFYWVSVNNKVELVDKEEPKEADEAVEIILEDKPVGNTEKVYHDTPIPKRESKPVADFRTVKAVAMSTAAELRAKDDNWGWRAIVTKGEVKVYWGYLQYADTKDSHFTIKMSDKEEWGGVEEKDFMVAIDEHGYFMFGAIVGEQSWADGNFEGCVKSLMRKIASRAHRCY